MRKECTILQARNERFNISMKGIEIIIIRSYIREKMIKKSHTFIKKWWGGGRNLRREAIGRKI